MPASSFVSEQASEQWPRPRRRTQAVPGTHRRYRDCRPSHESPAITDVTVTMTVTVVQRRDGSHVTVDSDNRQIIRVIISSLRWPRPLPRAGAAARPGQARRCGN